MKIVTRIIRIALLPRLLALGVSAHAQRIEAQLDCKSNGHDFIAPLVAGNLIQTRPMRVEANSVNAFRSASGVLLTAYGFRVYAVVAYQKNDPLFEYGKGEPIADSAYGVVVWGGDDEVTQKVRVAGSDVDVHHVAPFIRRFFASSRGAHGGRPYPDPNCARAQRSNSSTDAINRLIASLSTVPIVEIRNSSFDKPPCPA